MYVTAHKNFKYILLNEVLLVIGSGSTNDFFYISADLCILNPAMLCTVNIPLRKFSCMMTT